MLFFRQNMCHHVGGACVLPENRKLENGFVEVVRVDQSDFQLPDVESTRLSRLLEAGVNLKEVPSRVMASTGDINIQIGEVVSSSDQPETKE